MRPLELLKLIRSNLLRMKFRVATTAAGVFIGTAAVVLLLSLGAGLQQSVLSSFEGIGDLTIIEVSAPGNAFFGAAVPQSSRDTVLNQRKLDEFAELPGVVAVTPLLSLQGNAELQLNRATGFSSIQGIDTSELREFAFEMESGSSNLAPWQVLVGASVANNFFNPRTGEQLSDLALQGQTVQLVLTRFQADGETVQRTVRLRVVGVMAESGGQRDFSIYMPIRNVEELNQWATGERVNYNRDGYSQAMIKVAAADAATAVSQQINSQGFFAFSFQDIINSINITFLVIQAIVGGIGGLALLVAAFGIANTMIMSIYERTREIGLMKAVGATNRDVMLIFLGEAGAIGILGGIGGVIFGILLGQLGSFVGRQYLLAQIAQSGGTGEELGALVYTPVWLPIFAIAFAALVGVLSGIYPALRAIRLDPIAALRYE